jgi:D-alanyl-D-alanine carboxypeptidase
MNRTPTLVTTLVTTAFLLAGTSCSSDRSANTPTATVAPTSVSVATTSVSVAPTTVAPPPPDTRPPVSSVAPTTTPPVQGRHEALLSSILANHQAAGDFVGARMAVLDSDGTISEATAGTTTVDPASGPVDLDTPWNVGSVTKTFVAVVVLQLAEQGLIDLDAGIEGYMPDLAGADRITPRQLLQHTSGLNEYINDPTVRNDVQREWAPSELIAVAEAAGRVGEPGGAHHYANTNFIVLGEIIRQVTGKSWEDELKTRIVEPLGLTGTKVMHDERPAGYVVVDGAFVDATHVASPSIGGAAGQLMSTDRDLLRFAAALADGRLLSPASQTAMQTLVPADDLSQFGIVHSYGLGLEQFATDAVTIDGHMGTGESQSAFVGYDAAHHTAVAVMTNTAVAGPQGLMAIEALTGVAAAA